MEFFHRCHLIGSCLHYIDCVGTVTQLSFISHVFSFPFCHYLIFWSLSLPSAILKTSARLIFLNLSSDFLLLPIPKQYFTHRVKVTFFKLTFKTLYVTFQEFLHAEYKSQLPTAVCIHFTFRFSVLLLDPFLPDVHLCIDPNITHDIRPCLKIALSISTVEWKLSPV